MALVVIMLELGMVMISFLRVRIRVTSAVRSITSPSLSLRFIQSPILKDRI